MGPQHSDNFESLISENESEELRVIEERLKEKAASLERTEKEGLSTQDIKKELLKEIIRERIEEHPAFRDEKNLPKGAPAGGSSFKSLFSKKAVSPLKEKEYEEKLRRLVVLAFEKNILAAVEETLKMPPYYIDALHDALVDRFFNELLRLGKI